MNHPLQNASWIELSSHNFSHNITLIKRAIGEQQLAMVLKSNAYGHGILPMAKLAQKNDLIDLLCLSNLSEAYLIRQHAITKPLLVLAYLDAPFSLITEYDIQCTVYDYETAEKLNKLGQSVKKDIAIHIKVDTGMSRLGIMPDQLIEFLQKIAQLPYLKIQGIFTHLSDSLDVAFSKKQLELFDNALDEMSNAGFTIPCTHALSSSGLHIPTNRQYRMVRIGAAAYGLIKSHEHQAMQLKAHPFLHLQPVLSWKTHAIQIKTIEQGAYVGYTRSFQAKQPMKIAVVPVGYYEGYPRALSNNSVVLINGQYAPVIGIVSMNLMAIDITYIASATLESEIILIGNDPAINAQNCAFKTGLITNEFIVSLQSSISRFIV